MFFCDTLNFFSKKILPIFIHALSICRLTDVQAQRVMALNEILGAIASHNYQELRLRQQMLLSHLSVGHEFISCFPTTANFCRYFKRATGIYPQEYKNRTS